MPEDLEKWGHWMLVTTASIFLNVPHKLLFVLRSCRTRRKVGLWVAIESQDQDVVSILGLLAQVQTPTKAKTLGNLISSHLSW